MTTPEQTVEKPHEAPGAVRVLVLSTVSFTLMFAVWLMFGVLSVPIQKEFGLTDAQVAWILAVAILNGSIWRLFLGVLADRIGGKVVTVAMLALTAIPAFLIAHVSLTYGLLLVFAFLVGFAGNLVQRRHRLERGLVLPAQPGLRPRRLRGRQRRRLAHQVHRPGHHHGDRGLGVPRRPDPRRLALHPRAVRLPAGRHGRPRLLRRAAARPQARQRPPARRDVPPAEVHPGVALQPLLRGRLRRVRGAGVGAAQVLRRRLRPGAAAGRAAHRAVHLPGLAAAAPGRLDLRPDRRPPAHVLHVRPDAGRTCSSCRLRSATSSCRPRPEPRTSCRTPWAWAGSPSWSSWSASPWASARPPSTSTSPSTSRDDVGAVGGLVGMLGALGGFFLPPALRGYPRLDRAASGRPSWCSSCSP